MDQLMATSDGDAGAASQLNGIWDLIGSFTAG
jgi:hypothetical protein